MKIVSSHINGNYRVTIFDDGTKVRENKLNFFDPDFPESMDIKITNMCNLGCLMCHENSVKDGLHGDIINLEFIDKLHPGTELAIGGGNPLEHPDLISFLQKCKELKLIPSMTVNQVHFHQNQKLLKQLSDDRLIYGLGVSLMSMNDKFIEQLKDFPNAVIHVIAGMISIEDLKKLSNNNFKILFLGYKIFRRGADLYIKRSSIIDDKIILLKETLPTILEEHWFDVMSFDNLAIEQLSIQTLLSKEEWNEFYMGDDGDFTMYIDCINKTYSISSTSPLNERYPLLSNIKDMFNHLRKIKKEQQT